MTRNRFWLVACASGAFAAACGGAEFGASDEPIEKGDGAPSLGSGGSDAAGGASAGDGGSMSGSSGGRSAAGGAPGAGGVASSGGTANTGGTPSGDGGDPGAGGAPMGTGGSVSVDAGPPGAGGTPNGAGGDPNGAGGDPGAGGAPMGTGGTCPVSTTWFPDNDLDGYGRSTGTVVGCSAPPGNHWATVGGDCNDDDNRVHPNQTAYFTEMYSTSGGSGSFDYDCEGGEQGNPDQGGVAPTCLPVPLGCSGSGWVKTTRTAAGQNSLCGSFTRASCQIRQLVCQAVAVQVTDGYGCR